MDKCCIHKLCIHLSLESSFGLLQPTEWRMNGLEADVVLNCHELILLILISISNFDFPPA